MWSMLFDNFKTILRYPLIKDFLHILWTPFVNHGALDAYFNTVPSWLAICWGRVKIILRRPLERFLELEKNNRHCEVEKYYRTWFQKYRIRILQIMMLRVKFGRIRIRTNLLQRCDNNFYHFNDKFCYKIDKTIYDFLK